MRNFLLIVRVRLHRSSCPAAYSNVDISVSWSVLFKSASTLFVKGAKERHIALCVGIFSAGHKIYIQTLPPLLSTYTCRKNHASVCHCWKLLQFFLVRNIANNYYYWLTALQCNTALLMFLWAWKYMNKISVELVKREPALIT